MLERKRRETAQIVTCPFAPGDQLTHERFGFGCVVSVRPYGRGDADLRVAFQGDVGLKRLLWSTTRLRVVPGWQANVPWDTEHDWE
jgi:hypothetical protein